MSVSSAQYWRRDCTMQVMSKSPLRKIVDVETKHFDTLPKLT